MKSAPPVTAKQDTRQSFPLIDHHSQSVLATPGPTVKQTRHAGEGNTFWNFRKFFGGEAHRSGLTDFLVFTLIAGLSAWPIILMVVAVTRMFKNH